MINIKFEDNGLEEKLKLFMQNGNGVYETMKAVVNKTYDVAVEMTPTDTWYPKYNFPEKKSHELGYLKDHWHKSGINRLNGYYSAEVYNDAHYAKAVDEGHRAIVGQYIPPLPGRVSKDWVEGIHLTNKIEEAMTTQYANEFSNEYGAYLERYFS